MYKRSVTKTNITLSKSSVVFLAAGTFTFPLGISHKRQQKPG
jgi:hypothetical protein